MGNYIDVTDLRDEGLPSTVTDARANVLIDRAEALVETITRNYFRNVSGTFVFDGNNTYILHLPIAIITITSLTINDQTSALDTSYYQVWNGRQIPQDDRRNPKIVLKNSNGSSIFTSGFNSDLFLKGTNQTVVGEFGFLEPDDSVPLPIKEACIGIALLQASEENWYESLIGMGGVYGGKIRERTDDHEIEWGDTTKQPGRTMFPAPIWNRLMMYQAPRTMKIPTVRWAEVRG